MSRRMLLGLTVAVLGALLPGTASADVEAGTLVVEGQGGTVTEWVLEGPLGIDVPPYLPAEVTGGGPYAGALLEPLDARRSPVGAVQVRVFADETAEPVARLGVRLEPGRYRVTLLGRGPVRVVLPNNDQEAPGIRITTRTRIPVTFFSRAEALVAGYDSARIDLAGALPADRRALLLNLDSGIRAGQAQSCATTGDECEGPLVPFCPPAPAPCGSPRTSGPDPSVQGREPRASVGLVRATDVPRRLLWSFEGYRDTPGKLRAAALVF